MYNVDEVPVQAQDDLLPREFGTDLEAVSAQTGGAAVERLGRLQQQHRRAVAWPGRQTAGPVGPGVQRAAYSEVVQVVGGEVGGQRFDQFAVDEHVDSVLVGPYMSTLPGPCRAQPDPLDS